MGSPLAQVLSVTSFLLEQAHIEPVVGLTCCPFTGTCQNIAAGQPTWSHQVWSADFWRLLIKWREWQWMTSLWLALWGKKWKCLRSTSTCATLTKRTKRRSGWGAESGRLFRTSLSSHPTKTGVNGHAWFEKCGRKQKKSRGIILSNRYLRSASTETTNLLDILKILNLLKL